MLFGLYFILFEFVILERIFIDPFVADAVEHEIAKAVQYAYRTVMATPMGCLQKEIESIEKFVVDVFHRNIVVFASFGKIFFQITQQPIVFVCRALCNADADFVLSTFAVIGQALDEHQRVAPRIEIPTFDLQCVRFVSFGQQRPPQLHNFHSKFVERFVDLHG